jgi:hypothetical protein
MEKKDFKIDFEDTCCGIRFSSTTKQALELVVVEGKSQAEAAKKIGISPRTVSSAFKRFNKEWYTPPDQQKIKTYFALRHGRSPC